MKTYIYLDFEFIGITKQSLRKINKRYHSRTEAIGRVSKNERRVFLTKRGA